MGKQAVILLKELTDILHGFLRGSTFVLCEILIFLTVWKMILFSVYILILFVGALSAFWVRKNLSI